MAPAGTSARGGGGAVAIAQFVDHGLELVILVDERRTTGRRRSRSTNGRRRGRPRGSGTRSAQALALVQSKPGITISEMGKEMGITPNYLYRVLPELAKDGKVKKSGKGWEPA